MKKLWHILTTDTIRLIWRLPHGEKIIACLWVSVHALVIWGFYSSADRDSIVQMFPVWFWFVVASLVIGDVFIAVDLVSKRTKKTPNQPPQPTR